MMAADYERHDASGTPDNADDWPAALAYWRGIPAEQFDEVSKREVKSCVGLIRLSSDEWRAAIGGDPAAAIGLGLGIRMPDRITVRLDLAMTVLLANAFENEAAASVLADCITRAPLDRIDRLGLTTSWLIHKIWCESRVRNRVARRKPRRGGCKA